LHPATSLEDAGSLRAEEWVIKHMANAPERSFGRIVESADGGYAVRRSVEGKSARKQALTMGRCGALETHARTDHRGDVCATPLSHRDMLCGRGWHDVRYERSSARQKVTFRRVSGAPNPVRLSTREFQVVYLASLGCSGKQVAAELGLSHARVRTVSSAALEKLELPSCSHLPQLWCAIGRGALRRLDNRSCETVTFEVPFTISQSERALTSAEYQVLLDVLAGQQNDEIAEKRHTSPRTVANQLATLFGKFGVASRGELAAKALSVERAVEHEYWLSL
jgi:DNA-binding NarL/FixJ family response regulator